MLEGIGERFGSSFDDVRRDPRPAVVALLFDAAVLAALVAVLALASGAPPHARFLPFGVPGALPTFTDVVDLPGVAETAAGPLQGTMVAVALALALAPVAAWLEGGAVGALKAAYVDREQGALRPAFATAAGRSFRALLAYRLFLHGALVAGAVAGRAFPGFTQEVVGAIVLEFVLVFTPFAIVLDGESAWGGMKKSAAAVGDHLATCLVMLLFGLLVTGGASALARETAQALGPWAILPLAAVYAVVGTAMSTFLLKVWLSFRPPEKLAQSAPVRAAAPA